MTNRIIVFSIMSLGLLSCNKVDDLLTFRITNESTFRIESTLPVNIPFDLETPDITTNSDQSFQNNDTRADLVKDIKLETVDLTITNPSGKNFNFLKSVSIYIYTNSSNSILLASITDVPMNVTSVSLEPTREKLDSYVKASSYSLRTQIVTRETLTQAVDVKVKLRFKVTADPL